MKAKVIKTGEIVEVYHEPQHGQTTNIYKECVLLNGRMWTEDELDFCVKTSEAPEKIYIFENPILDFTKLSVKQSDTDIEYIRADAFIENAVQYLKDHKEEIETEDDGIAGWIPDYFIEDFKK